MIDRLTRSTLDTPVEVLSTDIDPNTPAGRIVSALGGRVISHIGLPGAEVFKIDTDSLFVDLRYNTEHWEKTGLPTLIYLESRRPNKAIAAGISFSDIVDLRADPVTRTISLESRQSIHIPNPARGIRIEANTIPALINISPDLVLMRYKRIPSRAPR